MAEEGGSPGGGQKPGQKPEEVGAVLSPGTRWQVLYFAAAAAASVPQGANPWFGIALCLNLT